MEVCITKITPSRTYIYIYSHRNYGLLSFESKQIYKKTFTNIDTFLYRYIHISSAQENDLMSNDSKLEEEK